MNINDMDDYTVNLADAYAKDAYQKGYAKGVEDSKTHQPLSSTEAFKGHCVHCFEEGYKQGRKDAVKHGHWKVFSHSERYKNTICTCSNCGWDRIFDDDGCLDPFCPGCGAKMDEKE